MKKSSFILLGIMACLLTSCGSNDVPYSGSSSWSSGMTLLPPSAQTATTSPTYTASGITKEVHVGAEMKKISLLSEVWGKDADVWVDSYDFQNGTFWGGQMVNPYNSVSFAMANAAIVLDTMKKENYKTNTYANTKVYTFMANGQETESHVNVWLLEALQKYGIEKLPVANLDQQLMPSTAKRALANDPLKDASGKIVGYANPCAQSNDDLLLSVLTSYCVLTYDGNTAKEYMSQLHFDQLLQDSPALAKEYRDYYDATIPKYAAARGEVEKSAMLQTTRKTGKDIFDKLYSGSPAFKVYIDQVNQIALKNY